MDLCASMLESGLRRRYGELLSVTVERPKYRAIGGRAPAAHAFVRTLERALNRLVVYPRNTRTVRGRYDAYHVCDHSYSHLVHELPHERTGVLCQDLDTFRCLLGLDSRRRSLAFRTMTRRILRGLQEAAVVFHTTDHVKEDLLRHRLVDEARLIKAPLGIAPEFQSLAASGLSVGERQLAAPYVLHVGSCAARKRIDLLLRVVAGIRRYFPDIKLVKVGEQFTESDKALIERLGLVESIVVRSGISRAELAAWYHQAAVTLVTSEREGFGLPVIEALACGSPVVASDIPPLREGGGQVATYCRVGDVEQWVDTARRVIDVSNHSEDIGKRMAWALGFTWERHAEIVGAAYTALGAR